MISSVPSNLIASQLSAVSLKFKTRAANLPRLFWNQIPIPFHGETVYF